MRICIVIFFSLVLLGCGGAKNLESTVAEREALQKMITDNSFEIVSQWALLTNTLPPLFSTGMLLPPGSTGNNINLTGNANFLKKQGDSIAAYLPFFGVRQMGGSYGGTSDSAIEFEGVPSKYKSHYNEKRKRHEVSFAIRNGTESFVVNVFLFDNLRSSIQISSSHRSMITYRGTIREL